MSGEPSENQDMDLYIRAAFLLDLDPDEQWCTRASLGLESEQADWVAATPPSVVKRLLNEKLSLLARIEQLEAERPTPIGYAVVTKEGDPCGMPEANFDEANQWRAICDGRDNHMAPHTVVALVPVEVPNEQ